MPGLVAPYAVIERGEIESDAYRSTVVEDVTVVVPPPESTSTLLSSATVEVNDSEVPVSTAEFVLVSWNDPVTVIVVVLPVPVGASEGSVSVQGLAVQVPIEEALGVNPAGKLICRVSVPLEVLGPLLVTGTL